MSTYCLLIKDSRIPPRYKYPAYLRIFLRSLEKESNHQPSALQLRKVVKPWGGGRHHSWVGTCQGPNKNTNKQAHKQTNSTKNGNSGLLRYVASETEDGLPYKQQHHLRFRPATHKKTSGCGIPWTFTQFTPIRSNLWDSLWLGLPKSINYLNWQGSPCTEAVHMLCHTGSPSEFDVRGSQMAFCISIGYDTWNLVNVCLKSVTSLVSQWIACWNHTFWRGNCDFFGTFWGLVKEKFSEYLT